MDGGASKIGGGASKLDGRWGSHFPVLVDKDRLSLTLLPIAIDPLVSSYGILGNFSPLGQPKVITQRYPGRPVRTRSTSFCAASGWLDGGA
jgi:hypothetical protein